VCRYDPPGNYREVPFGPDAAQAVGEEDAGFPPADQAVGEEGAAAPFDDQGAAAPPDADGGDDGGGDDGGGNDGN
jgi:hypothetical protein